MDFPIQDDLLFILLIDDFLRTGFSFEKIPYFFGELFRVDNDHCLMVPRVINLLYFAVAKTLDFKWQISLVAGLTIGLLWLKYQQFTRFRKPLWMFLPVVFFLLQPQYYEVSLWALAGLEHVGVMIFLLSALIFVHRDKLGLGLLFASLGTFTSGNGIFIFGAIGLYFLLEKHYRRLLPLILVFCGNLLVLLLIYKKGQENNLAENLLHLPQLFSYFLFLSGSIWDGILPSKWISVGLGSLLVLLFIVLSVVKLRRPQFQVSSLFLSIMAFNLVTLALIALGRFSDGLMETASRYQFYACVLVCSAYLVLVSLHTSGMIKRVLSLFMVVISFIYGALSFYIHTETVAYNKLAYQADLLNWKNEQAMFYIKPSFVNLVRPYFAATVDREIWVPNPQLSIPAKPISEVNFKENVRVFDQKFRQSASTDEITEANYVIFEIENLPQQANFTDNWYILLENQTAEKKYVLPIRFLANGKFNIMRGESYFRNMGYVKIFQGSLPTGEYNVAFLHDNSKKLQLNGTTLKMQILDSEVFIGK